MTAEWRPDPEGQYEYRWWDGQNWTDQVAHQGQVGVAPMGRGGAGSGGGQPGVEQAGGQPAGGQDGGSAEPQAAVVDQVGGQPQQQSAQAYGGGRGGAFQGITGDLVDGRYGEREAQPIANQNAKLLRVRVGQPFMARQGSMVAYQGNVDFAFEGGGASKFIKKALTGEGLPLMKVQGQGDVFLADLAYDVHLLQMNNAGLSVSGKNVLAFSTSLDWNIERVKGASIAAGGLFNTTLRGTGWVAITTDGPPVVLNAAEAPTFADTNAVVAWSANLQTTIKSSFKAAALIGRGSGEAFQVAFQGQGFVIIQPSEGFTFNTTG
ncbi:AIM24 family protein [Euzebya tangerina]|uniref:AIM24 family protein n=1 Tax=Euzebya tangerina TaxID=591198 RepID=UPI000E322A61|nr:AIM24 family protein [Euzebya tangerina]